MQSDRTGRVGSDGQAAESESDGWMAKKGIRLHPWHASLIAYSLDPSCLMAQTLT
jgi:hypothetical protein